MECPVWHIHQIAYASPRGVRMGKLSYGIVVPDFATLHFPKNRHTLPRLRALPLPMIV